MKLLAFVLFLSSVPFLSATEPAPAPTVVPAAAGPSVDDLRAALTVIRQQRDVATQRAQDLDAQLQLTQADLAQVKQQLAEAQKKIAEHEKAPAPAPTPNSKPKTQS